jgi:Holliday junction resolvase RusA-like endonuclease
MLVTVGEERLLLLIELEIPPSSNHYWKRTSTGVYKTAEAKVYEAETQQLVWNARPPLEEMPPKRAILAEKFEIHFPGNMINKCDWTNYVKLLEDSAMRALGLNDSWVRDVTVTKHELEPLVDEELEQAEEDWDPWRGQMLEQPGHCIYSITWTGKVDKPCRTRKSKVKATNQPIPLLAGAVPAQTR